MNMSPGAENSASAPQARARIWTVTPEEAGQKLLNFLQRRLPGEIPKPALMRWIRTGQVRIDSRRCKPFDRLAIGQRVRVPPCAVDIGIPKRSGGGERAENLPSGLSVQDKAAASPTQTESLLDLVAREPDMLVLRKPAGLPVHGGSGHVDSLEARLRRCFPEASFSPTPAHRLDRDSSGLLLVALSYARLAALHQLFRERRVCRIYLAWVAGVWPWPGVTELRDRMEKAGRRGCERVVCGRGKEALSQAQPLVQRGKACLLALKLETGRTHQLRVQLASRGYPILGDRKYGGPPCSSGLLLHAWRLETPVDSYTAPPAWPPAYAPPRLHAPLVWRSPGTRA